MATASRDRRLTEVSRDTAVHRGLDALVHGAAGYVRRRPGIVRGLLAEAGRIDRLAGDAMRLSDHALRESLGTHAERFRRKPPAGEGLHAAVAAVRAAAMRTLGMDPRPVQVAGVLALHRGYLVELATGEGKTLSAGVAAVLAGWTGRPCHIITANDYLAQRDAEWMGPLYRFCGLDAGYVRGDLEREKRREAYAKPITYTTGKEIVADFLRDRLYLGPFRDFAGRQVVSLTRPGLIERIGPVMRGLHTAIVDEADHILIDESVTPVILSAPHANDAFRDACLRARQLAVQLQSGRDFTIDRSYRMVELTAAGTKRIEQLSAGMPGFWRAPRRSSELIVQALTAEHLYVRGKQYVIQDGKIVIVDEFTGRLMPQRTWREGLHQSVEVKEGLALSDLSETSMRLSFQRFFRFFPRLSGMTGTAREAAAEFWRIYRLPVVCIPPHRPVRRIHLQPRFFARDEGKWEGVVAEIEAAHATGRPVLVGVRTVGQSERLSGMLEAKGLEHRVLNATRHREEAQIVAAAGLPGRITVATNMAGRGTDIRLGKGVAEIGGLHVIATEFHEAGRVDRQLYGRSGRQGDPGTAVTFASAEDELALRYLPAVLRRQAVLAARTGSRYSPTCRMLFRFAQRAAEARAARQRLDVLRVDEWVDESLGFSADGAETGAPRMPQAADSAEGGGL